jgi:hypothetical protein
MHFMMHSARAVPAAGSGSHGTQWRAHCGCGWRWFRTFVFKRKDILRTVAAEAAPRLALGPPLLPAAHHTGCARGR